MTTKRAVKTSEWVERVRALAPIVEKWRDAGEQERHMPRPLFEALRDAGVFRMSVPKAVGGTEVDEATVLQAIEELASGRLRRLERDDCLERRDRGVVPPGGGPAGGVPRSPALSSPAPCCQRRGHPVLGLPPDRALDVCERLSQADWMLGTSAVMAHGATPPRRQAGRQDLLRAHG